MTTRGAKPILGAFIGTITEYYDYSLYGFAASVLAREFFPHQDPITSLLNVFAIYSVAYFSKPLGSLIFSSLGDLVGRKKALQITILGIAAPTFCVGLLPNYETLGHLSTGILVLCRFLQGIFVAGEYDGAAIYVMEHMGNRYQYTASAITRATGVLGLLTGIFVTNFFQSSFFAPDAWRIPFLLSLPLALLSLYLRSSMAEPAVYQKAKQEKDALNMRQFLKLYYKRVGLVALLAGGFGASYQIAIIFMKEYLPLMLPSSKAIMPSFSILLVSLFGLSMPLAGLLADRFGRDRVLKTCFLLTFLASIALSIGIQQAHLNTALLAALGLAIAVAPFNALGHGIALDLFPVQERYRGISIGHTLGSMLMSGTANYICLYFIKHFQFNLFPVLYVLLSAWLAFSVSKNVNT